MAERPIEVEVENGHIASKVVDIKQVAFIWTSVNRTVLMTNDESNPKDRMTE
jgi:hypothetical protein